MRRALGASFALGETVSYRARLGCAAGVFRLAGTDIRAAMPVLRAPARVAPALVAQGRAALDDPRLTPDRAMVRLANLDRALGMRIRRAGLEGRPCMDEATESAFRHVLTQPAAILAYDAALGAVILMHPGHRLLVVAMGRAK